MAMMLQSKRMRRGLAALTAVLGLAFLGTAGGASRALAADGCCGGGSGACGTAAAVDEGVKDDGDDDGKEAGKADHHGGMHEGAKKGAADEKEKAPQGVLLDLGNGKCPIMGGKADGKTFSEWNGLRIGHCCPMCGAKFAADPEGALKKAGIEWKDAAAAVKKVSESKGAEQEKAVAAAGKKWKVVRAPAAAKPGVVVDLANALCPVSGDEEVDGETFTVWNGLRVGLCCQGCVKKFAKGPEAFLDKAGIEWKDAAAALKAVNEATGDARVKALASLKKEFKVLEPAPAPEAKPESKKDK